MSGVGTPPSQAHALHAGTAAVTEAASARPAGERKSVIAANWIDDEATAKHESLPPPEALPSNPTAVMPRELEHPVATASFEDSDLLEGAGRLGLEHPVAAASFDDDALLEATGRPLPTEPELPLAGIGLEDADAPLDRAASVPGAPVPPARTAHLDRGPAPSPAGPAPLHPAGHVSAAFSAAEAPVHRLQVEEPRAPRPPLPLLVDVTPLSLSVETVSGFCDVIIARNTPVPCEQSRAFVTSQHGQTTVRVRVGQGGSERFSENTVLGELELSGLRAAARGEVQIVVTFILDTDGILEVRATDAETGRAATARLRMVGLPDADEVDRMTERQLLHTTA